MLLRPPEAGDVAARGRLGFHTAIERGYGHVVETRPMARDEAQSWYDAVTAEATPGCYWHVEVDGELAGAAFLHSLRETDRKAQFAVGMFAPQVVGRGLGGETTRLVLRHAFGDLGLHRVGLRVLAFNAAAIGCYRSCGFVEEGRERDSCRMGDEWFDDLMMAVLEDEFRAADRLRP